DDALVITTVTVAEYEQVARVYSVADLVRSKSAESGEAWDDYDSLKDLIRVTVHPDTWPVGNDSSVFGMLGTLIILQTEEVHDEIAQLLESETCARSVHEGSDNGYDDLAGVANG